MDFEEILNALEDLVENSWTLPMSGGRTVVDSAQILEFVKEMRLNLPEEIKRSKRIIKERDEIISRARSESEGIVTAAHVQAKHLVSQEEVYKSAQIKASEIVANAQNAAKELRMATVDYCDNVLKKTEETLKRGYDSITETRKNIRKSDK